MLFLFAALTLAAHVPISAFSSQDISGPSQYSTESLVISMCSMVLDETSLSPQSSWKAKRSKRPLQEWLRIGEAFKPTRDDFSEGLVISWSDLNEILFFHGNEEVLDEVDMSPHDVDLAIELASESIHEHDLSLVRKKVISVDNHEEFAKISIPVQPFDWRYFFLQMTSLLRFDSPLSRSILSITLNKWEIRVAGLEEMLSMDSAIVDIVERACRPPSSSELWVPNSWNPPLMIRQQTQARATWWQLYWESTKQTETITTADELKRLLPLKRSLASCFRQPFTSNPRSYPEGGQIVTIHLNKSEAAANWRNLVFPRYPLFLVTSRLLS